MAGTPDIEKPNLHPPIPVSYTHLDVYKRQGQFLADAGTAQTLVPVRYGIAVVVYAVESNMHVRMLLVEMLGAEEPVSYTHLDVYKRQRCAR